MGVVADILGLGTSFESSIQKAETQSESTTITEKATYTIQAGDNFWICQRAIYLDTQNVQNAVKIWDSTLIIKGEMC